MPALQPDCRGTIEQKEGKQENTQKVSSCAQFPSKTKRSTMQFVILFRPSNELQLIMCHPLLFVLKYPTKKNKTKSSIDAILGPSIPLQ